MLTTILALLFAVALAIGYAVVASRYDESSVGRRQVDTWAIVAAFACLLFMGTGAADAAREAGVRRGQVAAVRAERAAPPAVALRHRRPSLRDEAGEAAAGPIEEPAQQDAPRPGGPVGVHDAAPAPDAEPAFMGPIEPGVYRDETPLLDAPQLDGVQWDPAADGAQLATGPTPALWQPPLRGAWPVPTPRPIAFATPTATRLPIQPLPPTPPPPTEPIQALPTATPHCGSPEGISVSVQIERAEAERRGDELVVRYTAVFVNRSAFPVTVADLSVTALSGSSGSELYGHDAKPDMLLPPSDRIVIEGAVKLDKAPSPFGTTELCISFVGETCGQRRPYEVQRRCITVRGF